MNYFKILKKEFILILYLVVFQWTISSFSDEIHLNMNHTVVEGRVLYVDENNIPVQGMNVSLLFSPTPLKSVELGVISYEEIQNTGEDGVIIFQEPALRVSLNPIHDDYWAVRAGMGESHHHLRQSEDSTQLDYWRMRLERTVTLPRKINPRPMFANVHRESMPNLDETFAFDLELNDWVRPHGRGQHPDMIFTLTGQASWREPPPESLRRHRIVEYDVTLRIHFPNEADGILPVEVPEFANTNLHLGRVAPEEGYLRELLIRRGNQHPIDEEQLAGYWIRTRSRVDEQTGELLGARHGKIIGNIRYSYNLRRGEFVGSMQFFYIFSPDENRSMEFNGENLARDPQWTPRK